MLKFIEITGNGFTNSRVLGAARFSCRLRTFSAQYIWPESRPLHPWFACCLRSSALCLSTPVTNRKLKISAFPIVIHKLLVTFPFPIRLFARSFWFYSLQHIHDFSGFAVAVSCGQFDRDSVHEASRSDWDHAQILIPALHRWSPETGMARGEPKKRWSYYKWPFASNLGVFTWFQWFPDMY